MTNIQAICSECGAHLTPDYEGGRCPYCGTPIVMDHSEEYELSIRDTIFEDGEAFVEMGDWHSAGSSFTRLKNEYPYDYRGWWGLTQVFSRDFTLLAPTKDTYDIICMYAEKSLQHADAKEQQVLTDTLNTYFSKLVSKGEVLLKTAKESEKKSQLSDKQAKLRAEIADLSAKINHAKKAPRQVTLITSGVSMLAALVVIFVLIVGGTFTIWEGILLSVLLLVVAYLLAFLAYIVTKLISDNYLKQYKHRRKRLVREMESKS